MTRAPMSEDVFRPWAVRATLVRKSQWSHGGPKWHLYLWPEPGSTLPPEMVGPDDLPAIYADDEDAAIAYYLELLEHAFNVRATGDPFVWDLALKS